MKCWVFHERQLDAALAAYIARGSVGPSGEQYPAAIESMENEARAVRHFLTSTEARAHKLLGGASYITDAER